MEAWNIKLAAVRWWLRSTMYDDVELSPYVCCCAFGLILGAFSLIAYDLNCCLQLLDRIAQFSRGVVLVFCNLLEIQYAYRLDMSTACRLAV